MSDNERRNSREDRERPLLPYEVDGEAALDRLRSTSKTVSDAALASFIGVPYSTLASWRRRKSVPLEAFIAVRQKTGVDLDYLIMGTQATTVPASLSDLGGLEFEYAVALSLQTHGIENTSSRQLARTIQAFYRVACSFVNSLRERGVSSQDTIDAELTKWLRGPDAYRS